MSNQILNNQSLTEVQAEIAVENSKEIFRNSLFQNKFAKMFVRSSRITLPSNSKLNKVDLNLEQATKAQRRSRGIALLFL
jgi:hypothetical protein